MKYTSLVTFIYYENFDYGVDFLENVLELEMIMDQGFARVYKVSEKGYLGIVSKDKRLDLKEDTLISLSTNDVQSSYENIKEKEVVNLSEIKQFPQIPLQSFFFEDNEGHHFEIQEFLKEEDLLIF